MQSRTGRLHDRGWSVPATGAGYALALVSFILVSFARGCVLILVIGIVLLHIALFPLNVLISTRLFAVAAESRSRVKHRIGHGERHRRRHRLGRRGRSVVRRRLAGGHRGRDRAVRPRPGGVGRWAARPPRRARPGALTRVVAVLESERAAG